MFRKLKNAIDGALSALEGRVDPAEDVDRLLSGMREELIEARAALPRLEKAIEKLEAMQAAEKKRAADCVRRAGQAKEIDDAETLRLAVEYAERHQERAAVYGEKIEAARAELAMQKRSVQEMTAQLKTAKTHRDAIKIRSRRSEATESLRGSGSGAAARFDRIVDDIEDEAARASAERSLDEELGLVDRPSPDPWPEADPDDLAELQLEELKRRMAEETGADDA